MATATDHQPTVVVRLDDVVKLILGFLRDHNMAQTLRSLELETGLTCDGGENKELSFLRSLIMDGKFDDAETVLQPLLRRPDLQGLVDGRALAFLLRKQHFLELAASQATGASPVPAAALMGALQTLQPLCSRTEFNTLVYCLTLPSITDHPELSSWTPYAGRLQCFRALRAAILPVLQGDVARGTGGNDSVAAGQLLGLVAQAAAAQVLSQITADPRMAVPDPLHFNPCKAQLSLPPPSGVLPTMTPSSPSRRTGTPASVLAATRPWLGPLVQAVPLPPPPRRTAPFAVPPSLPSSVSASFSGALPPASGAGFGSSGGAALAATMKPAVGRGGPTASMPPAGVARPNTAGVPAAGLSSSPRQHHSRFGPPTEVAPITTPTVVPAADGSPPRPAHAVPPAPTSSSSPPAAVAARMHATPAAPAPAPAPVTREPAAAPPSVPTPPPEPAAGAAPQGARLAPHPPSPRADSPSARPSARGVFRPVAVLTDTQPVRALAFSGCGTRLAVGTNSRRLCVCNVEDTLGSAPDAATPLLVEKSWAGLHYGSVYTVAWSTEAEPGSVLHPGALLATGSNDTTVKVVQWSRPAHESPLVFSDVGTVRSVCFHDVATVASCGGGDFGVRLWDVATGDTHPVMVLQGHTDTVFSVQRWGDRQLVTGSGDGTVRMWDVRARRVAACFQVTPDPVQVHAVSCSRSGAVAAGLSDGRVAVLDVAAGKTRHTAHPHAADCRSVHFSPSGARLLSSSFDGSCAIMGVKADGLPVVATLTSHTDKVLTARWHPTLPVLATCSADRTVKLYAMQ